MADNKKKKKKKKKRIEKMNKVLDSLISDRGYSIEFCKQQIIILETSKEPFQESARNIDAILDGKVAEVNNAIGELGQAYQNRVDSGDKSDLFWRITDFTVDTTLQPRGGTKSETTYTIEATKLTKKYEPTGVGGTIETVSCFLSNDTSSLGITTIDTLKSEGSVFDEFYEPKDLHAIKLYTEPYSRDLVDTFVNVSIGTATLGTNRLYFATEGGLDGLEVGQIITSDPVNIFANESGTGANVIVGFGTTFADLRDIDILDITEESTLISYADLRDPILQVTTAPLSDGTYPTFTISISPDKLPENFGVPINKSPYVKQAVSVLTPETYGTGVKVKMDNSGYPNRVAKWEHFLEGYPDPKNIKKIVKEPKVGGGKTFFNKGFNKRPLKENGNPASEGHVRTITVSDSPFSYLSFLSAASPLYEDLGSPDNTEVNAKIDALSQKESTLKNDETIDSDLDLTNKIREEINQINLRIWSYRMQIGQATDEKQSKTTFKNTINTEKFVTVIDEDGEPEPPVYTMSQEIYTFDSSIITFDINV